MSGPEWSDEAELLGDAIDVASRDGFAVTVQRPAAAVILLSVEGVLDLWTSLPLLDAILDAFHERPELIAVDLSAAPSLDGTGGRVLVEAARHIEEGGVRLAVVCPAGSAAARLLERADARRPLSVHESVDAALGPWLEGAGELPAGA